MGTVSFNMGTGLSVDLVHYLHFVEALWLGVPDQYSWGMPAIDGDI